MCEPRMSTKQTASAETQQPIASVTSCIQAYHVTSHDDVLLTTLLHPRTKCAFFLHLPSFPFFPFNSPIHSLLNPSRYCSPVTQRRPHNLNSIQLMSSPSKWSSTETSSRRVPNTAVSESQPHKRSTDDPGNVSAQERLFHLALHVFFSISS